MKKLVALQVGFVVELVVVVVVVVVLVVGLESATCQKRQNRMTQLAFLLFMTSAFEFSFQNGATKRMNVNKRNSFVMLYIVNHTSGEF